MIYTPRPQFMPFHLRTQRWGTLVCHRRAGKTVAAVNDLINQAFNTDKDDGRYSYVAPFYAQAKAVAWDYLLRYAAPITIKANIAELSVEILNDKGKPARIRLFGGDNPDALRGLYHDGVIMDEPAQMKPRLWPEIIRPALSDRKGWAVFTGTPAGKNEFWGIWQQAINDPANWFSLMLKASESGILDQQELNAAKSMMDADGYAQEYECSFDAAIRGSFYGTLMNELEERGQIITNLDPLPGYQVHTAWDLGFTDDTVCWYFQVVDGKPRIFDCYAASGLELKDYIDQLFRKQQEYGFKFGNHYLPHDAKAKSLQTGRSTYEQLLARDVRGRIIPDMSVQDGIQATRLMLPNCTFDKTRCAVGIEALKQYQREWDEDKKAFRQRPKHDWTSDYADALRMLALGYREDYTPQQPPLPMRFRDKPLITEGVTLDELWETLPKYTLHGGRI